MPLTPRQSPGPQPTPTTAAPPRGEQPHARDYVTALEPRGLLEERLSMLLPTQEPVAMLIVDVIGLKAVNEQEGFLAGDAMLRAAADRLQDAATGATLLARLGGDELVALFLGARAGESACRAADKLAVDSAYPALRACSLTAAREETAAGFIERLYATLRRS